MFFHAMISDTTSGYRVRPPIPFLGVSLSNRLFSSLFAKRLTNWLCADYNHLEVLLGDECEVINYCTFRGLTLGDARRLAQRRADEIGRMFQRVSRAAKFPIFITAESRWLLLRDTLFKETYTKLEHAYTKGGDFWHDVRSQVKMNLCIRERRLPTGFVSSHLDDLALYVVRELAVFYTLRAHDLGPALVELYPGPQLFVKERLFEGEYSNEIDIAPLKYYPIFINVAFLVPIPSAKESNPIPFAETSTSACEDARPMKRLQSTGLPVIAEQERQIFENIRI